MFGLQDFFKKHGVAVMNIKELFDFIVDASIADDSVDSYLEEVFFIWFIILFILSVQFQRDLYGFQKNF